MDEKNTFKIFITNIHEKVTRKILYELIIQASKVSDIYYNAEKGYCFVRFNSSEEMLYAYSVLNGIKLYGKKIYLNIIEKQTELIMKNVGIGMGEQYILNIFNKYGSCKVEMKDNSALIKFKKKEFAEKAFSALNGATIGEMIIELEYN